MSNVPTICAELRSKIDHLPAHLQEKAHSLLRWHALSERQIGFMQSLIRQADAAQAKQAPAQVQAPAETIDNVSGIVDMLNRAKENTRASKLKGSPQVNFLAGDLHLSLSLAGEKSRYQGAIYVTPAKGDGWYGCIAQNGTYDRNRRIEAETQTAIITALHALAQDPRAAALAYSKKMGVCCFCARPLLDPVSVYVGYGPVCAVRWSLPHRHTGLTTEEVQQADTELMAA